MMDKVKMIAFVLVLGAVLTTALVSVDAFTAPFIKANQAKRLQQSILKAAEIEFTEASLEQVYSEKITAKAYPDAMQTAGVAEENKKKFYLTQTGDVIFEYRGSGLQDEIYGVIAFEPDVETIKGITIVSQKETPGLGGRIAESEFLEQFKGKKFFPQFRIRPPGKASGINEIDGLTGATLSCNALEALLNKETNTYIPAIKESLKK
ncbi:MAG: FMN-binding protein [Phycisphaerae bacterium]|nr:FMN-binding protein [Phycisphaerae bacterium]